VVNNIQGGNIFLGELVASVLVVDQDGNLKTLAKNKLQFDYDFSRFHHTQAIIISVCLILNQTGIEEAKQIALSWAQEKAHQPQNSLGCIFQNISEQEKKQAKLPTPSVGYLIDQVLKMKGQQVGAAKISAQHSAFIENTGSTSAQEYLALIKKIKTKAKQELGLTLKPEIFFVGFTEEELSGIIN